MIESPPHRESEPTAWSTDSRFVREPDGPVRVPEAVVETPVEAVGDRPEPGGFHPVFEFVDTDESGGLFEARAVEETSHTLPVESPSRDAPATVMDAATVRVIVGRGA